MTPKHNHITRDIKPPGECPSCDAYHSRTLKGQNDNRLAKIRERITAKFPPNKAVTCTQSDLDCQYLLSLIDAQSEAERKGSE